MRDWKEVPIYPEIMIRVINQDAGLLEFLTRIPVQDVQKNWWLGKYVMRSPALTDPYETAIFMNHCHKEVLEFMHNADVSIGLMMGSLGGDPEFVYELSADQNLQPFKIKDGSRLLTPIMKKADPGVTTRTDLREEGGSC